MAPTSTPLVGRGPDLARLDDTIAAGRRGSGGGVLLLGEAGVGKTRLLRAALAEARAAGDLVLEGHCSPATGSDMPYLPFIELLSRLQRAEPATVASLLASYPQVGRLLPSVTDEDRTPLTAADLFESVAAALIELAGGRPVVLAVEDAHWADTSSRDLLGFLLTRMVHERVTVIITIRSDDVHRRHPLRPALAEWTRLPGVVRLQLEPLGRDDLRQLVTAARAEPVPESVVTSVWQRSGGNPFFAESLIAEIDRARGVPDNLADLLLIEVERLSPDARQLVQAAATAGHLVTPSLLADVVDLDEPAVDAALREAMDARVLVPVGKHAVWFRHALLAEAVEDDMLPSERLRLHRSFVRVLVAAADPAQDADLARHARESRDWPMAAAAAIRAGDRASAMAAPAEALSSYESALDVADQVPDLDLVDLVIRTSTAASLAGHPFRALSFVRDALGSMTLTSEQRSRLLVEAARHQLALDLPGDPSADSAAALALIPEDPPTALRAEAMAVHARAEAAIGHPERSLEWATEAAAVGRALSLPDVVTDATTTVARASGRIGDPDAARKMLKANAADAAAVGDTAAEIRALHGLGGLAYEQGHVDEALSSYRAAARRGSATGRPWATFAVDSRAFYVMLLVQTGRFDEALAAAQVADGEAPPSYAEAYLKLMTLPVLLARDVPIEQVIDATQAWTDRDGMLLIQATYADIERLGRQGDPARVLAVHDQAVTVLSQQWSTPWFAGRIRLSAQAVAWLGGAQLSRGESLIDDARHAYDELEQRQPGPGPDARAWMQRGEAELLRLRAVAEADSPTAEQLSIAWRDTVAAYGYGDVVEATQSRIRYAEVLQRLGDAHAAGEQLALASESATGMRATAWLRDIERLRTGDAGDSELTAREMQVLRLVADGLSNSRIAAQLFISAKTVSVHVSNVLAKLDASSRTHAVAIARRRGLLETD